MCNMNLHLSMCNLHTYILYQHVRLLPQNIRNHRTMFDFSAFPTLIVLNPCLSGTHSRTPCGSLEQGVDMFMSMKLHISIYTV